mmetsp:Transcript_2262/g.9116  ORF Transcript_2262/g.9116 Transcript_2262/m.9116 type:complete len:285 (-) Transcript_2262:1583-2437(-)
MGVFQWNREPVDTRAGDIPKLPHPVRAVRETRGGSLLQLQWYRGGVAAQVHRGLGRLELPNHGRGHGPLPSGVSARVAVRILGRCHMSQRDTRAVRRLPQAAAQVVVRSDAAVASSYRGRMERQGCSPRKEAVPQRILLRYQDVCHAPRVILPVRLPHTHLRHSTGGGHPVLGPRVHAPSDHSEHGVVHARRVGLLRALRPVRERDDDCEDHGDVCGTVAVVQRARVGGDRQAGEVCGQGCAQQGWTDCENRSGKAGEETKRVRQGACHGYLLPDLRRLRFGGE